MSSEFKRADKAARADQIAKHYRQVAAFGLGVRRCNDCLARSRCGTPRVFGDGFKHPLAVAERDSQLFEIRFG